MDDYFLVKCDCGFSRKIRVWPFHCVCGQVHESPDEMSEATEKEANPFLPVKQQCRFRGKALKKLTSRTCGCPGGVTLYECEKFGTATLRRYKPAQKEPHCFGCTEFEPKIQ